MTWNHFPKASSPNAITLGIMFSTQEFWRDTNIQTISSGLPCCDLKKNILNISPSHTILSIHFKNSFSLTVIFFFQFKRCFLFVFNLNVSPVSIELIYIIFSFELLLNAMNYMMDLMLNQTESHGINLSWSLCIIYVYTFHTFLRAVLVFTC